MKSRSRPSCQSERSSMRTAVCAASLASCSCSTRKSSVQTATTSSVRAVPRTKRKPKNLSAMSVRKSRKYCVTYWYLIEMVQRPPKSNTFYVKCYFFQDRTFEFQDRIKIYNLGWVFCVKGVLFKLISNPAVTPAF